MGNKHELTYRQTVERLKEYYDGYLFTPEGNRLYNPYSVLNALADLQFGKYWFQTATPTFLAKRIKNARILLPSLNSCRSSQSKLSAIGIEDIDPIPLLFQTGYLTIKSARGERYELQFPNKEVETGFAESLSQLYIPKLVDYNSEFAIWSFEDDICNGNPQSFMERLQTIVKNVPYEQHDEKFYQNVVYLVFALMGMDARVEEHSNLGRTDLVVRTSQFIYIFEFKYNRSAAEAMDQILERDYAGRFALSGKKVFLIGANFSSQSGGLEQWIIDTL